MKEFLSIVAIVLVFVGYAPYIRDSLKNKTKPHVFSWFIWTLVTAIVFSLQFQAGAGPGAWITLAITIISFSVFLLGFKSGSRNIALTDVLFLILSLLALALWVLAKQPAISIVLLSTTEMLGFFPTVRKTWNHPYTETLSFYLITTFRHALSILALAEYNIVTWLYPVTWTIANALFAVLLIVRRKTIREGVST